VGQARAVHALEFGLTVNQPGYNVFVSGPPGTGRSTYTRDKVEESAEHRPVPADWCYVRNFADDDRPIAMSFSPGQGGAFREGMAGLITEVRDGLRRAFTGEVYERQRREIIKQSEQKIGEVWEGLQTLARSHGLMMRRTPAGIVTFPVDLRGEPIPAEIIQALPEADQARLGARMRELGESISDAVRKARALERDGEAALRQLEVQTAKFVIESPVERLREQYPDHPKVAAFLEAAEHDMLDRLSELLAAGGEDTEAGESPLLAFLRRDPFARYHVNLLVDHHAAKGAPVVMETNPTYYNLIGKPEYRAEFGTLVTDFMMIKPGALHRANGGYLILQAREVLTNPYAYEGLKRALRGREIRIEPLSEVAGLLPTATLRPESIPLDIKVILIGTPELYYLLYNRDEEFEKFFKIRADFDVAMDRTLETQREYAQAIGAISQRCQLCPFDASGVAAVLEYGARLAGSQDKLSTRFNKIVEIVFEAAAWAQAAKEARVARKHVHRAIEEKGLRSNLLEEKVRELIAKGRLLVDTDGSVVGQINGLSVLQLGDYAFGQPSRITARAYVGGRGVVNIERETQMSGRIHSKGVFVLASFLANRFAQQRPLSLSASLTFEQLYTDVDGDSASATELYALLSELARLPVRQGVAVTGSVNQMGEIQPVGGVNEKIEGFYDVCKTKGLTGHQGVIIPQQNVRDLMLRDEVVTAVREDQFHIWAIRTVDEGIEILTGAPAGRADDAGVYPAGTVNGRVATRLAELAQRYKEFGRTDEERRERSPSTPS
jgi:predicted ATP-dependent protease